MRGQSWHSVALWTFVIAAATDWLDGYLARKMNLVTTLGKLLDPIADKVLVSAAFVYLTPKFCPVWVTALILTREFLVTGLRQIAVEKGIVMAADWSGKWKTAFQLAFCITALVWIAFNTGGTDGGSPLARLANPDGWLQPLFLWASVVLTVYSGFHYMWSARELLRDQAG
jgi:CDP-diacylglycerol--glycerol-3-phosphate 3-phosphatidyltransferase